MAKIGTDCVKLGGTGNRSRPVSWDGRGTAAGAWGVSGVTCRTRSHEAFLAGERWSQGRYNMVHKEKGQSTVRGK